MSNIVYVQFQSHSYPWDLYSMWTDIFNVWLCYKAYW